MNPYKADTKEYSVLENWLEFQDELETYLEKSEMFDVKIDRKIILDLLKFRKENHLDILKEKK